MRISTGTKRTKLLKMKAVPVKKKKAAEKIPPRDTVAETISFVIKSKLTPIKSNFKKNCPKVKDKIKKEKETKKPIKIRKKITKIPIVETKVQIKTAKKAASSAQKTVKNMSEKDSSCSLPLKKVPQVKKIPKKLLKTKIIVTAKPAKKLVEAQPASNLVIDIKKKKPVSPKTKKVPAPVVENEEKVTDASEVKEEIDKETQETIQKLLQQANRAIKPKRTIYKTKKKTTLKEKKTKKNLIPVTTKPKVKEENEIVPQETKVELPPIPDLIKLETTDSLNIKKEDEPSSSQTDNITKKLKSNKYKSGKQNVVVLKKRLPTDNKKDDQQKSRKSKLFNFWNGPKRHRVASLNALAKVHCLYENESRGNILDSFESTAIRKELMKKEMEPASPEEPSTRTLRSVPGLRAVGKHWDMHDTTSSSSSDDNSEPPSPPPPQKSKSKKEIVKKVEVVADKDKEKPVKKRRRNRTELIMDLKDMVVRKRMASLNATAILAASYSVEKRPMRSPKSDDDDSSETDSSDEYFMTSDDEDSSAGSSKKKCFDDGVKKEEDRKLFEVHTIPNKKMAVIVDQDTDVTITGLYMNSTTCSSNQDSYCSIAEMQYRISTSHTQKAASAMATETLLQSSSCSSAPESSSNCDSASSKSYTPLDALSSMQPPPGPGIQHGHPVIHGQQHMAPPLHQLSPGRRHGCASAFSSPHNSATYQPPPNAHHHLAIPQGELGYVHGYYQPAGPLITVSHGHGQPAPPPPPPPLQQPPIKSVPLSESSPSSSTPPAAHQVVPPPPPASSNGDSSDSEVIITSVTTSKESVSQAQPPPPPPPSGYRCGQYNTGPPGYTYSLPPSAYHYGTPPPPTTSYAHHEFCYTSSPYIHHKFHSAPYRRFITGPSYYSTNPQDIYPLSGPSQQLVTATPVQASGTSFPPVPNGPPPPTLIETYQPPPPTLVESYQQPPQCYSTYGPPPPCFTHSSTRAIPYMNPCQGYPCPMQPCPKNVLTGPLAGESKRSNISNIIKDTMPLPPVALALPLEPASATGPPSPARGSAGMPPPPSPAGATYQSPPTTVPKQESQSPEVDDSKTEIKGKARIGKDVVRNTLLLMCDPSQNFTTNSVKREIESPKEKELEQKKELPSDEEDKEMSPQEDVIVTIPAPPPQSIPIVEEKENEEILIQEEVPPCVLTTVAENVKVKNMKRKMSVNQDKPESETNSQEEPAEKKAKLGSYKDFIKKDTTTIKINSGKRKLIQDQSKRANKIKLKKPTTRRKLNLAKDDHHQPPCKQMKLSKPLAASNLHNSKQNCKQSKEKEVEPLGPPPPPVQKKHVKKTQLHSKSAPALLDNLIARNNIGKTIGCVVSESSSTTVTTSTVVVTTPTTSSSSPCSSSSSLQVPSALKTVNKCVKESVNTNKKSTKKNNNNNNNSNSSNNNNTVQVKRKSECKKLSAGRRKSKGKEIVPQVVTRVPRRSLQALRWSNGWTWQGEPYEATVFLNSDETMVLRKCYPAMIHSEGDIIVPRDCVLLKAGLKKNELPFVAKIASLWENPEDGEMMMSLLWYYRPEHTEQGRLPTDQPDEVFASRHKDSNSVACIDDKCYVLTLNEYCRYRTKLKMLEEGIDEVPSPIIPAADQYPKNYKPPPSPQQVSPEMIFFCRRVYDFRTKKMAKITNIS